MKRIGWLAASVMVGIASMLAPSACRAQAKCPWLNAATAGGVLGGAVQMTVTAPADPGPVKGVGQASYPDQIRMDRFDTNCEFSRKLDSGVASLHIVVKTMNDPASEYPSFLAKCIGTKVALKGIGNEAVQCVVKSDAGMAHEQVIARVRERAFVLTITRPVPPGANGDALRDDTRNMAEQVAGSLF